MNPRLFPDRKISAAFIVLALIGTALFIFTFIGNTTTTNLVCTGTFNNFHSTQSPIQLRAILHYATSKIVPQQSLAEITISFNVLKTISPCNFLVFGLGHDSLMWAAFNPGGLTVFLEEDPKWVHTVLKTAPDLKAAHVSYRTQLSEADELMRTYKSEPECGVTGVTKAYVRGNRRCKLALTGLPDVVYDKEWDMIMIDAPRGYFKEAPGRMSAIYTAAVMARNRKGSGVTHVFLHDVDRRVEKSYAEEFLCRKYLKDGTGRLWHFEIPPANGTGAFC
ncbi:putative glucuronoxylan 4-O-methyltransferase [Helianthus annuus]|uniref:Glucuronoxylan 4-O-methyltransferase n=1 Tax=Helianthus annuus TaxID=4232 RepID=A0A251UH77_HELAN|nr:probable methyltransferase At1g27930 [Helianthus annuus]KAF5801938.1 putative glucuronoxylan 4-O-methyltransferase [Helianthus annuus]KAJ0560168.1 putative glucuronoxylan 4-O-methyltransferase [Helianthus annuus]KAJ0566413.1 putative glucuronoxylan 4-O-methyltransferase [Helianthus annuus]KAJ0573170.1 putative glucuronoxylan 4-O-methyltransferase [Helianthus annuus]KAJ0737591.1 putative glucuronoxylan 4-O-methyltransferase [Helianthus annuus]